MPIHTMSRILKIQTQVILLVKNNPGISHNDMLRILQVNHPDLSITPKSLNQALLVLVHPLSGRTPILERSVDEGVATYRPFESPDGPPKPVRGVRTVINFRLRDDTYNILLGLVYAKSSEFRQIQCSCPTIETLIVAGRTERVYAVELVGPTDDCIAFGMQLIHEAEQQEQATVTVYQTCANLISIRD